MQLISYIFACEFDVTKCNPCFDSVLFFFSFLNHRGM